MGKRMKMISLLLGILVISIIINGCSTKDEDKDLDIGTQDEKLVGDEEETEENLNSNMTDMGITKLPEFDLQDLEGNQVSSDIFADYDITIVNIWQST